MSIVRVGTIKLGVLRVLVTLLVAIASIAMADEVRVTMDDVIAQWTLREEQAQNVHIEWSETIAIPAESWLVHDHVANTYIRVPDRDVSIPVSYSLLLAGEMARYDSACDFWDDAYNGIISRFHSETYNGKYTTLLTEMFDAHTEQRYSIGTVRNQSGIFDRLRRIDLLPVVLMWRSSLLDDLGFLKLETFRIVESTLSDEGGGITISNRDSRYRIVYEIDLAVDKDLVPVEVRSYGRDLSSDLSRGQLNSTISITYSIGSDHVRVLKEWHIKSYSNSQNSDENEFHPLVVRSETDVTLTNCDLDPFVSEYLFELEAPPDTKVHNEFTGEHFILRADGSKRLITNEERAPEVTYQMLVDTESGKAVPGFAVAQPIASASSGTKSIAFYINAFALVCLAIYLFTRRNRRRSK